MKPYLALLLLLLLLACGRGESTAKASPSPEAPSAPVGLLRSPDTFKALGWRSHWEWSGAENALKRLQVPFVVVEPEGLGGFKGRLLVMPNVRNLHPDAVAAIEKLQQERNVKVLATYMTSYRQHDNSSWKPNNFALAPLFGADFHRWVGAPPKASALNLEGQKLPLGRHQAMLVKVKAGAKVLATWDDTEEAAIVEGPGGIYVGEDLFAPENSDSLPVLAVISDLINRLLPETARMPSETLEIQFPEPPFVVIPKAGKTVKIGLGPTPNALLIRAAKGVRVGEKTYPVVRLLGHTLVTDKKSEIEQVELSGDPYLEVLHLRDNGSYSWSAYRGRLKLRPEGQMLNLLDLEEYLAGVVPSEVPAYFPEETLKTMSVVARTFTLSHLDRHQDFDVCSEVHCQVYRGLSKEAESTGQAIASTTGQILEFQGKAADTTFHAVCGGVGEDIDRVWLRAQRTAYLRGWFDYEEGPFNNLSEEASLAKFIDSPPQAFCAGSGRFRWRESYSNERLKKTFGADFQSLKVLSRTSLGRVAEFEVRKAGGVTVYQADKVRWAFSGGKIGPGGLQSTLFYVKNTPEGVELVGGGWGHGVGLCQEGAAGRARAGQGMKEILEHYYPGTKLVKP